MRKPAAGRSGFRSALIMVLLVNLMAVLLIRHAGVLVRLATNERKLAEILMQLTGASIVPSVSCLVMCTLLCWGLTGVFRQKPSARRIAFVFASCATAVLTLLTVRVNSLPMHAAIRAIIALAKGGVL